MLLLPLWTVVGSLSAAAVAAAAAAAQPAQPAQPPHLAREKLGAAVLAELASRTNRSPSSIARQLLGGGDDYAPYSVSCPSDLTWIRPADSLSSGEQSFIEQRQQYLGAINTMLESHGLSTPPRTPVLGMALSGGGYRAMTVGLGGVMGTRNTSDEAAASGVGGWFDGMTYMAGLSGGSWGTATFMANGGEDPLSLIKNLWNLESNLILPDDDKISFYYSLISEVDAKGNVGFPTQITDYWALALGNHLLPTQYHLDNSPNLTWSSLPSVVAALGNASLPMPIIIAAEREAGEIVVPANATVWEFTPYEFGSWAFGANEKVRGAFTPLEYLGTSVDNGSPNGTCYKGFDQVSFIMGTSSTLFNAGLLTLQQTDANGFFIDAIESLLGEIGQNQDDISRVPNTFANWDAQPNPIADLEYITLVDAGETNQNIPLEPLLVPERAVDAIIAFDSSADTTYSWPNGSALRTTYERALDFAQQENVTLRMPAVPSTNGFVNGGLNTRPVFFGCNETDTPIIVYIPNYPWSYAANVSTFQLDYSEEEATAVVTNGMRSFTLNGTIGSWPTCLGCALSDRAFGYTSSNRSSECAQCFQTWCWDGNDNSAAPSGEYEPTVGSVPAFFTDKNLVNGSDTTAPGATDTTATTQPSQSTGAASRAAFIDILAGWKGAVAVGASVAAGFSAVLL